MTDPEAPAWAQKIANYYLEFQRKGLIPLYTHCFMLFVQVMDLKKISNIKLNCII